MPPLLVVEDKVGEKSGGERRKEIERDVEWKEDKANTSDNSFLYISYSGENTFGFEEA